jgi:DNA mismatch repair protein MutL
MTAQEYRTFSEAVKDAPQPKPETVAAAVAKIPQPAPNMPLREFVMLPQVSTPATPVLPTAVPDTPIAPPPMVPSDIPIPPPPSMPEPEMEQEVLPMPAEIPWRMVGELYNSYIIVEQGEEAYLIDKHAAHERILFEKLKANQEAISSQSLLTPISVRLSPSAAGELLANQSLLEELGFEIEEFGENTVLLRQIPMDLGTDEAAETLETLAAGLLSGRREKKDTVRDELLHTVACKAAIKAGWKNDEAELLAVAKQVMARDDLKHCPHGRPICVTLSKKQLEKQFKRS